MNEIKFLKNCIDKANGFDFIEYMNYINSEYQNIVFKAPHSKLKSFVFPAETNIEVYLIYPNLLQSAIEGIEEDSIITPYTVFHSKRYSLNFDIYKNNTGKYKSVVWLNNYGSCCEYPELKDTRIEAKEYCLKTFFEENVK